MRGLGALLGGNANNGANAGFGYLNTNNRSSNSNANIGFRLYRGYFLEKAEDIYNCFRLRDPTTQGLLALLAAGKTIVFQTGVSK